MYCVCVYANTTSQYNVTRLFRDVCFVYFNTLNLQEFGSPQDVTLLRRQEFENTCSKTNVETPSFQAKLHTTSKLTIERVASELKCRM